MTAAVEAGRLTTRRVLIVVAIVAALGVAGIGGARSFNAVSAKFDSPLVPLVADGMIIACTALRLAALTRGLADPGRAGHDVRVHRRHGVAEHRHRDTGSPTLVAHALAPLAYAVLVEMLAHLLRLHMKLAQPAKPRLSALTWFTSPVITTRVWLHLARTGTDDPVARGHWSSRSSGWRRGWRRSARAAGCWPFDAARVGPDAPCLQTIRDGLLSASDLAALLPAGRATDPGRTARAGRFRRARPGQPRQPVDIERRPPTGGDADGPHRASCTGHRVWLIAFLLGALGTGRTRTGAPPDPAPHRTDRCTGARRRPERCTRTGARTAPHHRPTEPGAGSRQ